MKVTENAFNLTSVKLQDTALPFLSTWGRRINSFPPWNNTNDGSCLERGEADTLYLQMKEKVLLYNMIQHNI